MKEYIPILENFTHVFKQNLGNLQNIYSMKLSYHMVSAVQYSYAILCGVRVVDRRGKLLEIISPPGFSFMFSDVQLKSEEVQYGITLLPWLQRLSKHSHECSMLAKEDEKKRQGTIVAHEEQHREVRVYTYVSLRSSVMIILVSTL